jgi:hypothetical protein
MATDDPFLDGVIDALVDGPRNHNEIARAMPPELEATGAKVNSYLYTHTGRFFSPDREPSEGIPTWTLSGPLQRKRLQERNGGTAG